MSITIKKDAWRIKDDNGNYRSATLFSTMLPNEAQQLIDDTRAEFTEMEDEADAVLNDLADAKQEILDLETQTVNSVNSAGSMQKSILITEGTNQKNSIVSLANTKKQEVTNEGTIQVEAVNAKGQEVLASIPQDFSDLTDLVDRTVNAGFIYGDASGEIASFDDGADDMLIKSLVATWEPNQELHGFDKPWVGGSGKNLLEIQRANSNVNDPVTFTKQFDADGNCIGVLVNGTATAFTVYDFNVIGAAIQTTDLVDGQSYVFTGLPSNGSTSTYGLRIANNKGSTMDGRITDVAGRTFTKSSDMAIFGFMMSTNCTVTDLLIQPMIRPAAETDATFEPYQNYCPINGRTGLTAQKNNTNFAWFTDRTTSPINGVTFTFENGVITATGTGGAGNAMCGNDALYLNAGTYSIFNLVEQQSGVFVLVQNSESDTSWPTLASTSGDISPTFTLTRRTKISIRARVGDGVTVTNTVIKPMLVLGTEAPTEFVPCNSQSIDVSWSSQYGTVYGGSVDIVTGKMNINRRYGTFGTTDDDCDFRFGSGPNAAYPNTYVYSNSSINSQILPIESSQVTKALCSHLPSITRGEAGGGSWGVFQIHTANTNEFRLAFPKLDQFSTLANLNSWLHEEFVAGTPLAVCFPLKEPIEYQITPQQVTTLLGKNNIWIDGATISVTYPVDTKTYIDRKIEEKVNEMLGA